MQDQAEENYCAFLLRLWREEGEKNWRASLEDPRTGERQIFSRIERLLEFLLAETERRDHYGHDD